MTNKFDIENINLQQVVLFVLSISPSRRDLSYKQFSREWRKISLMMNLGDLHASTRNIFERKDINRWLYWSNAQFNYV